MTGCYPTEVKKEEKTGLIKNLEELYERIEALEENFRVQILRIAKLEMERRMQQGINDTFDTDIKNLEQERDKGVERLKKLEVLHENLSKNDVHQYGFIDVLKTRLIQVENSIAILEKKTDQHLWNDLKAKVKEEVEALQKEDEFKIENVVSIRSLHSIAQDEMFPPKHAIFEIREKIGDEEKQYIKTLKLCSHHKPIKFGCGKCEEEKQISESNMSQQNPVTDVAQGHIADAGKKLDLAKLAGVDKTVTIYEAIKAFREGYTIKSNTYKNKFRRGKSDNILVKEMLLADDWVIEDDN